MFKGKGRAVGVAAVLLSAFAVFGGCGKSGLQNAVAGTQRSEANPQTQPGATTAPDQSLHLPTQAYFTDDDGATYFVDDINKVPPFDHDGRIAVRCYVFRCPDGKKFVGYLEKYTNAMAAEIRAIRASSNPQSLEKLDLDAGRLIKKPGDGRWISVARDTALADSIAHVTCPDNSNRLPTPVYP